ncbi:MAG: sigma-54-dependent Fis family transcriptional regulator, partial [Deltaproteobacteria bacterium]|nr:sigma-54-dependent Fis family transcriptional regulator [Deltaproteobacteria bacterium]MBW2530763.1 sigma-54-dependent Fis family transcriptional regulator [Deltaproteobacteria bacterium]
EKGAFTGAISRKRGRFERSNHGTIFLDEIGELPPHAQVRLLRVLQNREIERVGGVARIPLDIRVIAATNRNLESLVRSGQFREDLWFRLNVFPIAIPPLRERKQDIPALIRHFIGTRAKALKLARLPRLAPGALEQLVNYDWPGNVRELQNVIERALILSRGDDLTFDQLFRRSGTQTASAPASAARQVDYRQMSVRYFTQILDATDGRIQGPDGAAELTGLNPSTLRSKLRKLGVPYGARR